MRVKLIVGSVDFAFEVQASRENILHRNIHPWIGYYYPIHTGNGSNTAAPVRQRVAARIGHLIHTGGMASLYRGHLRGGALVEFIRAQVGRTAGRLRPRARIDIRGYRGVLTLAQRL